MWGGSSSNCSFLENALYYPKSLQDDGGQTLPETSAACPHIGGKKQHLQLLLLTITSAPSAIKSVPFLPLRSSAAVTLFLQHPPLLSVLPRFVPVRTQTLAAGVVPPSRYLLLQGPCAVLEKPPSSRAAAVSWRWIGTDCQTVDYPFTYPTESHPFCPKSPNYGFVCCIRGEISEAYCSVMESFHRSMTNS